MRKVIRNTATGSYFSAGKWVDDWRLAQPFEKYEDVDKCVRQYDLKAVELHYIYGTEPTPYDWAIPLD
jgi:hypothetical protein